MKVLSYFIVIISFALIGNASAAEMFEAGFAKLDITPTKPLRLDGYGSREKPFDSIDEKLYTRAMALKTSSGELHVIVSVETIGFAAMHTDAVFEAVHKKHSIPRNRFVLCSTHSHTAPHIVGGLQGLYAKPLTKMEKDNSEEYTKWIQKKVVAVVDKAVDDLAPAKISVAEGEANFAENRRVLKNGIWSGFGVNPEGPVDHSLPVLNIVGEDGKTRGVIYNYACHCTTFGGQFNRVSADWAGYASKYIEEKYPNSVALCTIGCGADANPPRGPRGVTDDQARKLAIAAGKEIAEEVQKLVSKKMKSITSPLTTSYGFAGLAFDRPTKDELKENLKNSRPQVRRHAENMLRVLGRKGRLPETYPAPVQVWRFGNQLTMVFLGGEVVVDYAIRLKKEIKSEQPWITAYANDVFAYVASERIRKERGYEAEFSMIYYNKPGPWMTGTEEVLVRRVHELIDTTKNAAPYSPEQSLNLFHLPKGYEIELVVSEPMVVDPINFAFDESGRLWVVEMSDYPGKEKTYETQGQMGRVKVLTDTNNDGKFDKSTIFLDKISFPTGVTPWRDGVIISAAPEIIFAKDTNGDDVADEKEILYSGFDPTNPQHRINGFSYGLDGWLYMANGGSGGVASSKKTSQKVNMRRRDFRIHPDTGEIEVINGYTQYGRCRDDWGTWYGSTNSKPLFQFVIDDHYVKRNPFVASPVPFVSMTTPARSPEVFPTSRTVDRFNDLHTANRITSACGTHIFRDAYQGKGMDGNAFVCEPVHNLVHRVVIDREKILHQGSRHPEDQNAEFLSSKDNWFRPVWLATGPDGALWVADMQRKVIEHPDWIPDDWQDRLNLRAGEDRGRIYRIFKTDKKPKPITNLKKMTSEQLVFKLGDSNGTIRDAAQRLLVQRDDESIVPKLEAVVQTSNQPLARSHALWTLHLMEKLSKKVLVSAVQGSDPDLKIQALRVAESWSANAKIDVADLLIEEADHPIERVRFQFALTLGNSATEDAAYSVFQVLSYPNTGDWIQNAVLSSCGQYAEVFAELLAADLAKGDYKNQSLFEPFVRTAIGNKKYREIGSTVRDIVYNSERKLKVWHMQSLESVFRTLQKNKIPLEKIESPYVRDVFKELSKFLLKVRKVADSDSSEEMRIAAIQLLGYDEATQKEDIELLASLLTSQESPTLQKAVIESLSRFSESSTAETYIENWRSSSPEIQSIILQTLLSRKNWTMKLLDGIEEKVVFLSELDSSTRELLLKNRDESIRKRASVLLASIRNESREKVIKDYQEVFSLKGNPIHGAERFAQKCAACHLYRGIGNDVGAPLKSLKDKSTRSLITAILDPGQAVEKKYRNYAIVTNNGLSLSGMILSESSTSLQLAMANGTRKDFLRRDLLQLSGTGKSFMPEGLEKELSKQNLADVIAFLQHQPIQNFKTQSVHSEFNGFEKVIRFHDVRTIDSFIGKAKLYYCGGGATDKQSQHEVVWQSKALPIDVKSNTSHQFRVPIQISNETKSLDAFIFKVNGVTLADIKTKLVDQYLSDAQRGVKIHILEMAKMKNTIQAVLFVSIPAKLLKAKEPNLFSIQANDLNTLNTIGILGKN